MLGVLAWGADRWTNETFMRQQRNTDAFFHFFLLSVRTEPQRRLSAFPFHSVISASSSSEYFIQDSKLTFSLCHENKDPFPSIQVLLTLKSGDVPFLLITCVLDLTVYLKTKSGGLKNFLQHAETWLCPGTDLKKTVLNISGENVPFNDLSWRHQVFKWTQTQQYFRLWL